MTLESDTPPRPEDVEIIERRINTSEILTGYDFCLTGEVERPYVEDPSLVQADAEGRNRSTLREVLNSTGGRARHRAFMLLHERIFSDRTLRLIGADFVEHCLDRALASGTRGMDTITAAIKAARDLARGDITVDEAERYSMSALYLADHISGMDRKRNRRMETLDGVIHRALQAARRERIAEDVIGSIAAQDQTVHDIIDELVSRYNVRDPKGRKVAGVMRAAGSKVRRKSLSSNPRVVTRSEVEPEAQALEVRRRTHASNLRIRQRRQDAARRDKQQKRRAERQAITDEITAMADELVLDSNRFVHAQVVAIAAAVVSSDVEPRNAARSPAWLMADFGPEEGRWQVDRLKEYLAAAPAARGATRA